MSSLASTPKRLPSAKRLHGYGTLEDLSNCETVQIWNYFFRSKQYTSATNFWAKRQKQEKAGNWEMKD